MFIQIDKEIWVDVYSIVIVEARAGFAKGSAVFVKNRPDAIFSSREPDKIAESINLHLKSETLKWS